jgi:uncharacterized membrane protein
MFAARARCGRTGPGACRQFTGDRGTAAEVIRAWGGERAPDKRGDRVASPEATSFVELEDLVVAATIDRRYRWALHPIHAALLAGTVPLFLGVLLSDIAYSMSYEMQWKNFASWLLVGGLVFCGLALLWALVGLFRPGGRRKRRILYLLLLLATWVLGFVNAIVHAKDAWATMPEGLILSTITAALAITATGIGFSTLARENLT